jgi:hypothetical protein
MATNAYYVALQTQWATLTGTTAAKLAAINALTVAGPNVDVSVSSVVAYLALNAKLSTLQNYAQTAVAGTGSATIQSVMAARELIALIGCPNAPSFGTSVLAVYTVLSGMLAALVSDPNTGLVSADQTALLALAATTIPWWQANGYAGPFTAPDLVNAGGLI